MSDYAHVTADERDRIAGLVSDGLSLRALGRAPSTISRELRRNALDSGVYRSPVEAFLSELGKDVQIRFA